MTTRTCPALDLRGDERIIDAGGGLGALARVVLDAYPSATVTVLDRPEVIELASRAEPGRPGLELRAADLFEPWELEADVVLLSRVLHDWDDREAGQILANARAALPAGGRAFVIEMALHEDAFDGALCDLHLLVATGGRERSAEEMRRLFDGAGFRLEEVRALAGLPSIFVGVAS